MHMPVRELFYQARHLTPALKPCILASPLAVSQHLPAGLNFDVVIFDEASRISPAGAINSIYRGRSVILAGDQRQLAPAGFASDWWRRPGHDGPCRVRDGLPLANRPLDAAAGLGSRA